ncbi:LiaF transmembrane domain-containing protein [Puia sp. P3]|uniref:LiaF transmembrane domain-containing protein n=1 Tax=Puia sp. P3 TaxID=3423952 RepID=UPI003D670844
MDDKNSSRRGPGRIWAGLFLLLVGGVLLLDQMGFPLPDELFHWHVLLIALGVFIGFRHNFRGGGWLIMIVIGGIFLAKDYYPDIHIDRYIWPGVLILVGLLIILRPNRNRYGQEWRDDCERRRWRRHGRNWTDWQGGGAGAGVGAGAGAGFGNSGDSGGATAAFSNHESISSDDFIDTTSIFGGVHKKVLSKNFKGGDVTTVLGGTEIDLSQADFTGKIRMDVTQIMGGTKIIVPPHWEVRSEITAVLAGFEDKRQQPYTTNPEKILIIEGTSVLGGIELKNF